MTADDAGPRGLKYPHLLPEIQELADADNATRIDRLKTDFFIPYTEFVAVGDRIAGFLKYHLGRAPCLGTHGPPGSGKTHIFKAAAARFGRPFVDHDGYTRQRLILVKHPPPSYDICAFYDEVIKAAGGVVPSSTRPARHLFALGQQLETLQTKIVLFDNLHFLLRGTANQIRAGLQFLVYLNDIGISIGAAGTEEMEALIKLEPQTAERFEKFHLPLWTDDERLLSFVDSTEAIFPLRRPSGLSQPRLADLVLSKSRGLLAGIVFLLREGAILAIETGEERITEKIIKSVRYQKYRDDG